MPAPKIVKDLEQFWRRVERALRQLDERTHGWLGLLANAARETISSDSALTSAAIAYFTFFSLFPLILLSIFIASFKIIPLLNQQFILSKIEFIAPALGQLLGQNISHIIQTRAPVTAIALITLIWSASNVFNTLNQTLYEIWGYQRPRRLWEQRGLAILFVLAFVGPILIVASFASSVVGSISTLLPTQIKPLVDLTSLLVAVLLDVSLFMLLYILFPHGRSCWRAILPGAIGAGLLWELAKIAFLAFVASYVSVSNLIYGSVATIIAFLTWAYLSGHIFLFGAYLSLFYVRLKRRQQEEVDQHKEPQ